MKAKPLYVALIISLLPCAPVFGGATDTLSLLGLSKSDLIRKYGAPVRILGPEDGYQTYEYSDGLGIVVHQGTVVQYVAKAHSDFKTDKGISLGSHIGEVTRAYGDYTDTQEVKQWFGGGKQRILYHHPAYDRYKLNYFDSDVIFLFDRSQQVESIWVGYIFPKE